MYIYVYMHTCVCVCVCVCIFVLTFSLLLNSASQLRMTSTWGHLAMNGDIF